MRLKSAIWVAAYIRRCNVEGLFAAVRRRGAEEAGAIFVKLNRLDGTAELFGPAPQTAFGADPPTDRMFARALGQGPAAEDKTERSIPPTACLHALAARAQCRKTRRRSCWRARSASTRMSGSWKPRTPPRA